MGRQTEEAHVSSADNGGEFNRHTLRPFSASSTDGVSDVELLCLADDYIHAFREVVVTLDGLLTFGEI